MSLGLELLPARAFLRRRSSVAITALPGFVRGRHRLPTQRGRGAEEFVHELGHTALAAEVRAVYDGAKQLFGLRRRQLQRGLAGGGGNVEAPQFRFVIELGLDPVDIGRALWVRQVALLVAPRLLPGDFDGVFPVACDELVVPFASQEGGGSERFDELVDRLEDFAGRFGGEVAEDEDQSHASVSTPDGSHVALDLGAGELSLRFLGVAGCREVLLEAQRRFAELAMPVVTVLEGGGVGE